MYFNFARWKWSGECERAGSYTVTLLCIAYDSVTDLVRAVMHSVSSPSHHVTFCKKPTHTLKRDING